MTKIEYDKLNNYLNQLCLVLDKNNPFLLNNLFGMLKINDSFYSKFRKYEKKVENIENKLTFDEVIEISKEIINYINPKYLKQFEEYESTGKIDFNYEDKKNITSEFRSGSYERYTRNDNKYIMIKEQTPYILISRKFNYDDVIILIHEFFHSLNRNGPQNINNSYLTEFISIYFETVASEYLVNQKGVKINEINLYHRLDDCINCSRDAFLFEYPLISFIKFGNIDDNSYKFLNKYIRMKDEKDIDENDKNNFYYECERLLSVFEKSMKKFKTEEDFFIDFSIHIMNCYKYVIGTLLAFYSKEKLPMEKMIYLNDNINNFDFNMLNPLEALNKIGIDAFDKNFFETACNGFEKYLKNMEDINEKGEVCLK